MENAFNPPDSAGHVGNVALFIPRSMRGGCRRYRESTRRSKRGPRSRERSKRDDEERESKERRVDGMDVHHLALYSSALLRRRLRRARRLSFFTLTPLASWFFFHYHRARPFRTYLVDAFSQRRVPEDESRGVEGGVGYVATASLHASPVTKSERDPPCFVVGSQYCRFSDFSDFTYVVDLLTRASPTSRDDDEAFAPSLWPS